MLWSAGCDGVEFNEFFETEKNTSEEDVSEEEAEEVDDQEKADQTLSDPSQGNTLDSDVESEDEQPLDDFIIFRKGIDYRKHVVLPANFMSTLYKQSYGRS